MIVAAVVTLAGASQPWFLLRTANGSVVAVRAWHVPVLGWLAVGAALGLALTAFVVAAGWPSYLGFVGLASGLYTFGLALVLLAVGASASRLASLVAVNGETMLSIAAAPGLWLTVAGSGGVIAALARWLLEPSPAAQAVRSSR